MKLKFVCGLCGDKPLHGVATMFYNDEDDTWSPDNSEMYCELGDPHDSATNTEFDEHYKLHEAHVQSWRITVVDEPPDNAYVHRG